MKTFHLSVGFALLVLCGCTHTVVGGGGYSADKRYRLWVTSHGASGKAYVDKSKKKLWVTISSRDNANYSAQLFQKQYIFIGSDLSWETLWQSNDVSVVFYDWGDNVSNYNNMKHFPASNHIATLSYHLDTATGKFMENK